MQTLKLTVEWRTPTATGNDDISERVSFVRLPNRVTFNDALEILKATHPDARRWSVDLVQRGN